MTASVTGGEDSVLRGPGEFEGRSAASVTRYSLAVVYQELLTGQRPLRRQQRPATC